MMTLLSKKKNELPLSSVVHYLGILLIYYCKLFLIDFKDFTSIFILYTLNRTYRSPKIIVIPPMGDATGVSQKDAVVHMLNDWKVKENVVKLVPKFNQSYRYSRDNFISS